MSTRSPLRLVVLSAGLSVPSSTRLLADRLTDSVHEHLIASGREVVDQVIELRELAVDISKNTVSGLAAEALSEAIEALTGADALIAVTPIFNGSYSGLFKSFFDLIGPGALVGKPVLIAATGGTARHSLALDHAVRPLFAYLRAQVVSTAVFAAPEDWGGDGDFLTDTLPTRISRAGSELAELLRESRGAVALTGPDDVRVTPFAEQLAALRDNNKRWAGDHSYRR